jgi:hypothetical protein
MVRNDRIIMNISNHEKINVVITTKNYSFFEEFSYFKNITRARNFYLYILFPSFGSNIDKSYLLTFQGAE